MTNRDGELVLKYFRLDTDGMVIHESWSYRRLCLTHKLSKKNFYSHLFTYLLS